jgi:hypothetical protein
MKNVCFTSFNIDLDWDTRDIKALDTKDNIKYMIIQGELCKDNKKHIQGFIQFHTKQRMTSIKKLLQDNTLHIENMKGTPQQARDYCTDLFIDKDGNNKQTFFKYVEYGELDTTTIGQRNDLITLKDKIVNGEKINNILKESQDNKEIHNILQYNRVLKGLQNEIQHEIIKEKIASQYKDIKWKPIQQKILEILDGPVDERQVNWIYDQDGNSGKSYIAKYLQTTKEVYYITGGKQNDILYGYEGESIVIIDLARTYADNLEHIYTIIENIKNGQYLSTKYETKQKLFIVPHIVVLANFKPDESKLSRDRWNILDTDDYPEIIENQTPLPYLKPKKRNIKLA